MLVSSRFWRPFSPLANLDPAESERQFRHVSCPQSQDFYIVVINCIDCPEEYGDGISHQHQRLESHSSHITDRYESLKYDGIYLVTTFFWGKMFGKNSLIRKIGVLFMFELHFACSFTILNRTRLVLHFLRMLPFMKKKCEFYVLWSGTISKFVPKKYKFSRVCWPGS